MSRCCALAVPFFRLLAARVNNTKTVGPNAAQYDALVRLVEQLQTEHPITAILAHSAIAPDRYYRHGSLGIRLVAAGPSVRCSARVAGCGCFGLGRGLEGICYGRNGIPERSQDVEGRGLRLHAVAPQSEKERDDLLIGLGRKVDKLGNRLGGIKGRIDKITRGDVAYKSVHPWHEHL